MNLFVRERESQGNSGLIWSMKRKKAWSNPNVLMKATKVPNIHYELYLVYLTICNILYNLKKKKKAEQITLATACIQSWLLSKFGGLWVCNFIFINFKVCTCGVVLFLYSSDYWGWSLLIVPRARTSSPSMGKCFHVSIVCSSATGCLPSFYW